MKVYVVDPWRDILSGSVCVADWVGKKLFSVRVQKNGKIFEVTALKGGWNSVTKFGAFRRRAEALNFREAVTSRPF